MPTTTHERNPLQTHLQSRYIAPSADRAYVLGVLTCDGWVTGPGSVGLNAKDKDFVTAFGISLGRLLNRDIEIKQYQYHYGPQWRALAGNASFARWYRELSLADIRSLITGFEGFFIRAVFDSDGTLSVHRRGPQSVQPVYRIWKCDRVLLELCKELLIEQGINAKISKCGRVGDRTVGNTIRLRDIYMCRWQGHASSRKWEAWAGSSIARKRYTGPGVSPVRCPRKFRWPKEDTGAFVTR